MATTLEDFSPSLKGRCPDFYAWIKEYGRPIVDSINTRCKGKSARNSEEKNYYLGEVTEQEEMQRYTPEGLLHSLEPEWARMTKALGGMDTETETETEDQIRRSTRSRKKPKAFR